MILLWYKTCVYDLHALEYVTQFCSIMHFGAVQRKCLFGKDLLEYKGIIIIELTFSIVALIYISWWLIVDV